MKLTIELPDDTTHAEFSGQVWNFEEGLTLEVGGKADHPCRSDDCPDGDERTHYHSVNFRTRQPLRRGADGSA